MGMTFTEEQKQVIDCRGKNLLVSAAAGSGKTAVLVERILKRITDREHPMDIDRMLIVTFTNAAAAEMRERIGAALEAELAAHPGDVHLQRQQTLLHTAMITTIHSFCLYVIRNYFHRIGLEPDFRIGEEGELRLLKGDVLDALLEQHYEREEPEFLELSETLATGKTDEKLKSTVLDLYEFAMSDPWPGEWLRHCIRPYGCSYEEFQEEPMYRALLNYLCAVTGQWLKMAESCLEISQEPDGPQVYAGLLEQECEQLEGLSSCGSLKEYGEKIKGLAFGRLPAARKFDGDGDKKQYVQDLRKEIKDSRKKLLEQFFFLPAEEMVENLRKNQPLLQTLTGLALEFREAFGEKKREKNMLDFNDLEHLALKILVEEDTREPSAAALELREQFDEIMIDEYQDSNYVQETILKAVARENNRFMVGDVKQSIYRFRMARPELFMEKYDTYPLEEASGEPGEETGKAETAEPGEEAGKVEAAEPGEDVQNRRIDLHKNFRSRGEVLKTVNQVFSCIMARDLGNVEYDKKAALYQGMEFETPSLEKMFQTQVLLTDPGDFSQAEEPEQAEAVLIARQIQRLMEEQLVTDKETGKLRPLRYQDVVILLRGIGSYGQQLVETLKDCGIPAMAATGTGYFSAMEVQTALNLLRLIDNPRQDIPMAAVLKSAIGGLTEEELAELRIQFPRLPFSLCVLSYGEQGRKEPLRKKIASFLHTLQEFRERAMDTPVRELLYQVLDETGYLDYAYALPGGTVRRANLEMLLERAAAYESTSYHGLFSFIRYMNQLNRYEVDYGEAEDTLLEDKVRVMTIHKSKGLEFPVVILAGMGRQMNQQDVRSRMILHPQLGIGLDVTDLKRRVRIPSLARQILARQVQMENAGEELRVLYVAMTRAKEKLILTGSLKKAPEKLKAFSYQRRDAKGHMGFLFRLGAGCYLDWVLPALLQSSDCEIRLVSPEELSRTQAETHVRREWEKEALWQQAGYSDPRLDEEIRQRLSFRYPYETERELKPKLSVSELKHRAIDRLRQEEPEGEYMFEEPEVIPYIPEFMRGRGEEEPENEGALRGTAMHRVLECFDFTRDFDTLQEQIAWMEETGLLEAHLSGLLSLQGLELFFRSRLAERMQKAARAGKLYKEKPFVMGKPASQVLEQTDSDVMILIQGIMDAYFEEDGKLVLVDYKTDAVRSAPDLVKRYQAQMDLYQEALSRAAGKEVKEKILYSFRLRREIQV